MARQTSFLSAFDQFAESYYTPPIYRRWGALWAVATAVTRKVWMETTPGERLYPNLYLMAVTKPGGGKTQIVRAIQRLFEPLKDFRFTPESLTRASFLDYMQETQTLKPLRDGGVLEMHTALALSDELGNLIPENDNWYLTTLNQLYDCPSTFTSRTRTHGELKMYGPYTSLFVGAQPQFLQLSFPEQAWGMGFMSRVIMIYNGTPTFRRVFGGSSVPSSLAAKLTADLAHISTLEGKMTWAPDAVEIIELWHEKGQEPRPGHPRLNAYNQRRILHLMKLSMAHSLAARDSLTVLAEDVQNSLDLLLSAEAKMPQVFLEMVGNEASAAMQDVANIVKLWWAKYKKPLPESMLINQLQLRIPPNQVIGALTNLIGSQLVKIAGNDHRPGMREFIPGISQDDLNKMFGGD